ncbi:hypothetical protein [Empedobacter sp. ULE_I140]
MDLLKELIEKSNKKTVKINDNSTNIKNSVGTKKMEVINKIISTDKLRAEDAIKKLELIK